MAEIRTLRADEYEALHRFLERSFGHGRGWFQRHQPALARSDAEALNWSVVAVEDGQIVGHVGTFPLPLAAGTVRIMCGGIGNVATAPEARGKGYMTQLLGVAIQRMQDGGWPLSVLWGDRTRYGHFGWERAGQVVQLDISRRGLDGVKAAVVDEVAPTDPAALNHVTKLHGTLPYKVERPNLAATLRRNDIRLFVGADGYIITRGDRAGNPFVLEVASPTQNEPGLILAAINHSGGSSAQVVLEAAAGGRTSRLMAIAGSWTMSPQGMFRINDWPSFLDKVSPILAERAGELPPFSVAIGCRWGDGVTTATVQWDGRHLHTVGGRQASDYVELEARHLTRLMLGTPSENYSAWGHFQRLLPVPLFIPHLDYV